MLGLAPAARAGEWVQRSCSYGGEYIGPEGWEAEANYGYAGPPPDNCERYYDGGGLAVYAARWNGTKPFLRHNMAIQAAAVRQSRAATLGAG